MHLAIDIREAFRPHRTGKGQWLAGFLHELLQREVELTLIGDDAAATLLRPSSATVSLKFFSGGMRWHFETMRFLRSRSSIDCYVSPTSYIVPALLGKHIRHIPIVHDLIAFRGEPHDRRAVCIERLTLARAVRTAAHVCTISRSTKSDLLERVPRLDAAQVSEIFAGPLRTNCLPSHPDGKTILCPATLCPRKNQMRLIRAYASLPSSLREQFSLVLVGGRGWKDEEIIRLARETKGVTWRDYVPDAQYESLLSSCTILAFPSLYEGFGLPVLDALQRGTPVLTSSRGSLTEVAGTCAVFIDPEDIASITGGLQTLLMREDMRADLSRRGPAQAAHFSWKRTVDLFLEAASQSIRF